MQGKQYIILVVDINKTNHSPDKKLDKTIDLDKGYVQLKLLSRKQLGTMQIDDLVQPHRYQQGLEKQSRIDIEDEDLTKGEAYEKFLLARGQETGVILLMGLCNYVAHDTMPLLITSDCLNS